MGGGSCVLDRSSTVRARGGLIGQGSVEPMRPEEAKWLLAIVNEHGDETLTRLVVWALQLDGGLPLLAPTMGAQPVDVLVLPRPIPDDFEIPDGLSLSWSRPVRDIHALVQRRSAWLARQRGEAPPRRGRPRGANAADAEVRADLARAVAAVWARLAVVIGGDSGSTAARRRQVATTNTPAGKRNRVNVESFPLTLGCWLLRRRGLSYDEIAERLGEVATGVKFDDLRSRARKYARVAEGIIAER